MAQAILFRDELSICATINDMTMEEYEKQQIPKKRSEFMGFVKKHLPQTMQDCSIVLVIGSNLWNYLEFDG